MEDHLLIQMVFDVDACGDCVAYSPHLNGEAFIKDFPQKNRKPRCSASPLGGACPL